MQTHDEEAIKSAGASGSGTRSGRRDSRSYSIMNKLRRVLHWGKRPAGASGSGTHSGGRDSRSHSIMNKLQRVLHWRKRETKVADSASAISGGFPSGFVSLHNLQLLLGNEESVSWFSRLGQWITKKSNDGIQFLGGICSYSGQLLTSWAGRYISAGVDSPPPPELFMEGRIDPNYLTVRLTMPSHQVRLLLDAITPPAFTGKLNWKDLLRMLMQIITLVLSCVSANQVSDDKLALFLMKHIIPIFLGISIVTRTTFCLLSGPQDIPVSDPSPQKKLMEDAFVMVMKIVNAILLNAMTYLITHADKSMVFTVLFLVVCNVLNQIN